jgi:hypothetical protein
MCFSSPGLSIGWRAILPAKVPWYESRTISSESGEAIIPHRAFRSNLMPTALAMIGRAVKPSNRGRKTREQSPASINSGRITRHSSQAALEEWPTNRPERQFYVAGLRIRFEVSWTDRLSVYTQIATTATSRPEALMNRSMSSGSLVRIVAFCRRAVVTTTASTTSDVLVMPRLAIAKIPLLIKHDWRNLPQGNCDVIPRVAAFADA